ncbi:MAG: hypothetical protein JXB49_07145 [Bacteroidales bacterium]|nr:hypothetical protein [Bacteroidales bacterium]
MKKEKSKTQLNKIDKHEYIKTKEENIAKYSTITAVISALVAIIALFISIWTTCTSIKYSNIAISPILQIDFNMELGGLYVKNVGNNIAIIDNMSITKNNKTYIIESDTMWLTFLKDIKFENELSFLQIPETYNPIIRANDNYCLIGYKKDNAFTTTKSSLKSLLKNCEIKIEYRDLTNKTNSYRKIL